MNLRRVLVIAPQGTGDALEATPLLAALKQSFPDATVDVVALRPATRDFFEALRPLVNDVIYLPFWEKGAAGFAFAVLRRRWRKRYDLSVLCYPAARWEYHALSLLLPAKRRVAHRYAAPRPANFLWVYDRLVPVLPHHNVLRNLDMLEAESIPHEKPVAYVLPPGWVAERTHRTGRPHIAIHVGTIKHNGLESRRWPLQNFVQVARHFAGFCDVTIVMGPAEREESLEIHAQVPGSRLFESSMPDLARFLSSCDAVLSNDSGVAHLAAATGVSTVSLFGPTPLEHAPFGSNSYPLRPTECPPCFDVAGTAHGCKLNIDFRCLKSDLPVELVIRRLEALVQPSVAAGT